MEATIIRKELVDVLQFIQVTSNLGCPPLLDSTKPVGEIPKFDSKIWPVAVGMLSVKLGITIAPDVNIFRQEKSTKALSISEIVIKVAGLADKYSPNEAKQVNSK